MQKITRFWYVGMSALAMPSLALAAANNLNQTLGKFDSILNSLVAILVAVAVIVFFWGLIMYLTQVGEQKHQGLIIMFYGILTLTVMVSIWGLVALLQGTFSIDQGTLPEPIDLPKVNR